MRVISGTAKGHGLKAPKRLKLRPTPARVKEALFSSLAERIAGSRVLELFAGTGAFGIECLSRGAAEVTLVEKDGRAASFIQDNLQKTRLTDRARLLRADVRQALDWLCREQKTFDLIFADPPYLKVNGGNQGSPRYAAGFPTTPKRSRLAEAGSGVARVVATASGEARGFGVQGSKFMSQNLKSKIHPFDKLRTSNPKSGDWAHYLLNSASLCSLLAPEGVLLVEHFKKDTKLNSFHFVLTRQFRFGDTIVSAFCHGGERSIV